MPVSQSALGCKRGHEVSVGGASSRRWGASIDTLKKLRLVLRQLLIARANGHGRPRSPRMSHKEPRTPWVDKARVDCRREWVILKRSSVRPKDTYWNVFGPTSLSWWYWKWIYRPIHDGHYWTTSAFYRVVLIVRSVVCLPVCRNIARASTQEIFFSHEAIKRSTRQTSTMGSLYLWVTPKINTKVFNTKPLIQSLKTGVKPFLGLDLV